MILDPSTGTLRATHVELFVAEKDRPARKEKSIEILVSTTGALLEAGFTFGPLDEKGRWIPGPALADFTNLDITSPETRAIFQRELDFWVKGIGRKPPSPAKDKPASKP